MINDMINIMVPQGWLRPECGALKSDFEESRQCLMLVERAKANIHRRNSQRKDGSAT